MQEFKRLSKEECADRLLSLCDPLIICHVRPDGDTVATAKALSVVFKLLGKSPRIACADRLPKRLAFILRGEDFTSETSGGDAVTVDVASPSQMGALYEARPDVSLAIDHHAVNTPFADNYTDPEVSSAAEALAAVVDVLIERGLIAMTPELAEALYTAISSDTGCFCYSNAKAGTHMLAARLIAAGIDTASVNHRLFHTKGEGQIRAEGFVGANLRTALDGRVAYATVTESDILSLGVEREDLETAIDVVRSLEGSVIAFTVKETAKSSYKISLRSTAHDVSAIAKSFGGGGHILAAGCTVSADTPEGAAELILEKIKEII